MTVKQGVPLEQTGLVGEDTEVARALSIGTVEEFVAFIEAYPEQSRNLLPHTDIDGVLEQAQHTLAYSVSAEDNSAAQVMRAEKGTGALAPMAAQDEERSELHLEDIGLVPGPPGDAPEIFLQSCLGPVRDQGRRGTCVAHAVVAMQECLDYGQMVTPSDLSEQFLYWMCKLNDGSPKVAGTWQRVAVPLLVSFGCCDEQTWPYDPAEIAGNESQGPPPNRAQAFADAQRHAPTCGVILDGSDLDGLRARLRAGSPIGVSVPVYSNWWMVSTTVEGHIPMPIPGESPDGGHAMCMVGYGYDSAFLGGGYFIVRNSWGVDWAAHSPFAPGYGTLPFSYVSRYSWETFSLD